MPLTESVFTILQTSTFLFIPKYMDTDAIGDLVDKLKAIQNDNVEDQDQDDDFDDDDDDDEEHEPITLGFVDKPKNNWSLRRQYFPSKAGGVPVLYRLIEFVYTLLLSCFIQRTKESVSDGHMICCDVNNRLGLTL